MQNVFSELSIVIAIAAGVALLMRIIRQPLIIGHILTGILVGPSVLHLIKSPDTIEVFAKIGIALLLFIIGLGLNPQVVKEVGKVAGSIGLLQVSLSTLLGWIIGIIMGLGRIESFFFGLALAFSSTIIILKLLSDKKEQGRLYGKIAIGLLLVQDVIATFALLFATAHRTNAKGFQLDQLGGLAVKGAVITTVLFIIGTRLLPKLHNLIAGSQEFLFLFAIGWGFGTAAIFEQAGFSIEVGALLAGVALAALPYTQEISARLRPLRDFFVIVFFISLGTRLSFGNILPELPLIIAGSVLVMAVKPFIVMMTLGAFGYTKRTSFKTASSIAQVSEFSLVFMLIGQQQGLVSEKLVSILTFIALISIAYSSYMIIYADKIFSRIEKYMNMFEGRKTHTEHESKNTYDLVLFGYQRGGHEFLKVFQSMRKRYVVIDYDPEVVDTLEHRQIPYIYGDATDVELLEEAGLDKSKLIVSTITDHSTNIFLVNHIEKMNPHAVLICHSDTVQQAEELYELGASYVMMPHYIGSEKISAFIKKNGLSKSEFKKYRNKHLAYLQAHFTVAHSVEISPAS